MVRSVAYVRTHPALRGGIRKAHAWCVRRVNAGGFHNVHTDFAVRLDGRGVGCACSGARMIALLWLVIIVTGTLSGHRIAGLLSV